MVFHVPPQAVDTARGNSVGSAQWNSCSPKGRRHGSGGTQLGAHNGAKMDANWSTAGGTKWSQNGRQLEPRGHTSPGCQPCSPKGGGHGLGEHPCADARRSRGRSYHGFLLLLWLLLSFCRSSCSARVLGLRMRAKMCIDTLGHTFLRAGAHLNRSESLLRALHINLLRASRSYVKPGST